MNDDFNTPQPHEAPKEGTVAAVLARLGAMGNSLVSLLTGLLAAVLILYSGYVLYDSFYTQNQAFSSGWELLQYKPEIIEDGTTPLAGQNKLAAILENYRAWLTMYETNIDYPVMQGSDDLFYASHDIYGESSLTGSIYLAAGNTPDLSDTYNLIYGHHMDNGAMFGVLDRYLDESYLLSHKTGVLVSATAVWDLEVFAVIETDAYESKVYSVGPQRTVEDVLDFLQNPTEKTTVRYYDSEAVEGAVKITALSTCASAETNGRLVVFCVTTQRNLIQLEIPSYEGVYDALPHSVTATPSYVEGTTVEYSIDGGVTWTTEPPSITDVGTIEVMARATNDTYGRAIATGTLTVHPRPVTVTANPDGKVYGTEDPAFSATVDGVIDAYVISYELSRPGVGVDENVGSYEGAIIPSGEQVQGNYVVSYVPAVFTITPAPMTVIAVGYEGVYDAAAHPGAAQPSVPEGTTLEYSVDGGVTWTTEPPAITDVGTQSFMVRATNPNYTTATDSAELIVHPRPVVVTANGASKVFGEDDPAFSASVSGVIDGFTIVYELSRPGAGTDEAVGTYADAIIPSGEQYQGNYVVSYVPADFTITDAGVLTVTGVDYNGVYDANPPPAYAYANITEGTTIWYSLDGVNWTTVPPTILNVGTQTVYVRATNPNYAEATATLTLTVTPAPVVVTAAPAAKAYGEEDPAFTATVTGVIDNFVIQYTLSRPGAGRDEAVGSYEGAIIPAGEAAQGNYTVTYVPASFTITPLEMTLTAIGYEGVYDAEEHGPTVEASVTEGTVIEYSIDGGATWTTEMPTILNVGTVEVMIRATNPNYETQEATVQLTVTPRPALVRALGATKIQGADDPAFGAAVDGVIDDFQLAYTVSRPGAGTDEAAGFYENAIIASGETLQGNYSVTYIPGNFNIIRDNTAVTPDKPDEPQNPENPGPEGNSITDPDVPLSRFFEIFRPAGDGGAAWALVNLLCLISTIYLFIPLLHLRDKFGRAKLMKKINEAKRGLQTILNPKDRDAKDKLRINLRAAENMAGKVNGASDEERRALVSAAELMGFETVTPDDFGEAVDELYYRIKKFLRRFRIGLVSELILSVLAFLWFIWTEDMRLPMVLIDKWTPLMVFFLAVTWLVDVRLARYREKVEAEEDDEREAEAEKEKNAQNTVNV